MSYKVGNRAGVVLVFLVLAGASGCSSPDPDNPSEAKSTMSTDKPRYFIGTAEEHTQAMVTCMNDSGYAAKIVTKQGDDPAMEVNPGSDSPEAAQQMMAAHAQCIGKVGELQPTEDGLSEASVRVTYEWVSGQYKCLEDSGFILSPMKTWESYFDDVQRSGGKDGDAFGYLVNQNDYVSALATCPRTTDSW